MHAAIRSHMRSVGDENAWIAMVLQRGSATRRSMRTLLSPLKSICGHDDDSRIARQNVDPLADQTIDFRIVVRDRRPIFAIAVLTHSFAIRRMERCEEMIH